MPAGLSDLVDCTLLAEEEAVLERAYALSELPRVKETLAEPGGELFVKFAFDKLGDGRSGARLTFETQPALVCQRCLQGFRLDLRGGSEVEFASDTGIESMNSERELFRTKGGQVSLRELAEEELLLALPFAPVCSSPLSCGKALSSDASDDRGEMTEDMRRPFSALQDLLKKT